MDSHSEIFLEPAEQGHLVHDMKSPFNGIVGLTGPMAKMAKEPEKKKQLTWINVCGARWCKHIESTVDSNLLAAGTVDIRSDKFNLGFIVEEACAIMSVAKDPRDNQIKNANVTISNTVPLDGLTIVGSDPHTSKCIYHLLTNAIKFTVSGTITVSHKIEDSFIIITITDTGCGISNDQLEKVFLPFIKFNTTILPGESLGLGLSSTREYIEFVGGKVTLQSEGIGKGTSAELWIPKTALNIGQHTRGPFGFGNSISLSPYLLQKRALGILAHDLLPAHYGIAGMAEVLINNEPKAPVKKQLGMILRSGNRVVEVLSLIRDSTIVCESGVIPRSIPVDIQSVCNQIVEELNKALDKRGQPMKKKTVEFINDGETGNLVTDPFYLYRLLYQLCDNALKFTAEGKVVLSLNFDAADKIYFEVSDTGCGFDQATKLNEIFKPFHRLEPDTYYGIGLGLNMVCDIGKKLNGVLTFLSEKGKGTVAKFSLSSAGGVAGSADATVSVAPVATEVQSPPTVLESVVVVIPAHPLGIVLEQLTEPVAAVALTPIEPTPTVSEEPPVPDIPPPQQSSPDINATPELQAPVKSVAFDLPIDIASVASPAPAPPDESAGQPKNDEPEEEFLKRKTLAGDKYRLPVEMDDGAEQPSHMSALGHLSLAIENLKERTALAQSMSNGIKTVIKKIEDKYRF